MEKIQFTDPDTNEVVEFAVEIKTQDEEVFYEMVDDDTEFAALAKIFAELADEETQLLY